VWDEKMHSVRVYAFGITLFWLHCGLKNISGTENWTFSSSSHSHLDAPSPFPIFSWIPSVPSICVVLISCTPWVNYFVSLWIFLTSNKGINQTSVWVYLFLFLPYLMATLEGRVMILIHITSFNHYVLFILINSEVKSCKQFKK